MTRRVASWSGQVIAWVLIIGVITILSAAVLVPRLAGATPYTIETGSMRPHYPPGTLVVSRPVDVDDVAVGDVITYQLESGEPAVVTHRVVAVGSNADGVLLRTQGDANDVPDAKWVRPVQVRGRLWYAVPYLGYASNVLTGQQHEIAVYVAAGALAVYALVMFAGAIRDRRTPPTKAVGASRG